MNHVFVLVLALGCVACRSGCDVRIDEMSLVATGTGCPPCGVPAPACGVATMPAAAAGSCLVPTRSLGGYRVATTSWNPFTGPEAHHKIMMDAANTATMLAGGATPLGALQLTGPALEAFTAAFQQRTAAVSSQEASLLAQQKALIDLGHQLTGGASTKLGQGTLDLATAAGTYLAKRPLLALGLPPPTSSTATTQATTTASRTTPASTYAQRAVPASTYTPRAVPARAPSAPLEARPRGPALAVSTPAPARSASGLPPPVVRRASAAPSGASQVLVARAR